MGMIEEFLKEHGGRVSLWGKWLIWDESSSEWVVLITRHFRARENTTLYRGEDLYPALKALEAEEGY